MQDKTTKTQQKCKSTILVYADMLIVVAFLVVNLFGFCVITRHHDSFEGRHLVGILPTELPELSKPNFRDQTSGKPKF